MVIIHTFAESHTAAASVMLAQTLIMIPFEQDKYHIGCNLILYLTLTE